MMILYIILFNDAKILWGHPIFCFMQYTDNFFTTYHIIMPNYFFKYGLMVCKKAT